MNLQTSRPRIVHVAPVMFGPTLGGGERFPLELSLAMAKRIPTTLVTFGNPARTETIGPLDIKVISNWIDFRRFRFDPFNPLLLRQLARADIIHYHQTHTIMASVALLYARILGKPIFTTHLGGGGYGLHRFIDVSGWYSGHLHLSQFSRKLFGHDTLPNSKVIYGGVDPKKFCPDQATARTGEVLFVGRVLPHKGINYLIEAVDPTIPLTIVGHPMRHAQRFYADLQGMAVGKRVTFLTDCADDQLIHNYRAALCVVLPSVHKTIYGEYSAIPELLGLTLLEGMACSTPAICTNVTSLPEVVEEGVTGFIVPPNDPAALGERIRWLREHPAEAARMGLAARERVLEKFTWDAAVNRCLEAYGVSS